MLARSFIQGELLLTRTEMTLHGYRVTSLHRIKIGQVSFETRLTWVVVPTLRLVCARRLGLQRANFCLWPTIFTGVPNPFGLRANLPQIVTRAASPSPTAAASTFGHPSLVCQNQWSEMEEHECHQDSSPSRNCASNQDSDLISRMKLPDHHKNNANYSERSQVPMQESRMLHSCLSHSSNYSII